MRNVVILIVVLIALVSCKSPEARRPISSSSGSFIDRSIERNKQLYAQEKALFEAFMEEHPEHDYITSQNGFWYYFNTKVADSLITPSFGDIVNFDFNIKKVDGNIIYSKEELKNQNYAMDQEELFTGLREGLKLMRPGETATFMFPSQKAFGYYGDDYKIGMNVPLICEVTVNTITQPNTKTNQP